MGIKKGERIGVQFSSTYQPKKNGRLPNLAKKIATIPPDSQEKIYSILHYAISLPNFKEAKKYLEDQMELDMEYGYILQIAIKHLGGKNGWLVLSSIMDRLYGKPKETHEVVGDINLVMPKIDAEDIEELKKLNGIK